MLYTTELRVVSLLTRVVSGRDQADASVELARQAGDALTAIIDEVLLVADMNTQIAAVTELQGATAALISAVGSPSR